ncbi:opioid growth factor receptor-like protein 1 [Girardinichthys multiradiatus]|uniref:opioid growth factor receptor-like protein 1 n=1 Tax=Girardinichthys multiradiatus TaxID=208333 RepID=UPI001FACD7F5|nr:opioid growth factor receptor-like protein 1 [Girardinichthys multiradiatus]
MSWLNLFYRIRRRMPGFKDLFYNVFGWFIFGLINPLWRCISRIPALPLFSGWRRRGEIEHDPEQSEDKQRLRKYSSDVKAGVTEVLPDNRNESWPSEKKAEEEDELHCDYDSTWESEHVESLPSKKTTYSRGHRNYKFSRFENAARDMWNYRHDYPNLHRTENSWQQEHDAKPNLNFYLGNTPSLPDGVYIKDFHNNWYGDHAKLECVHTFIQWLFPLQEPGMNYEAKTLTKQEIQDFLNSDDAKCNLRVSYELMLDFYGIKLKDVKTGEVTRAANWSKRFQNLNRHTHNNLRITRILKCLGTLGYPHYQAPLVQFFLEETLVNNELQSVKDSALSYFVFAVLNRQERQKLLKFAYEHYEPKEEFVWCPKKIQRVWSSHWQE